MTAAVAVVPDPVAAFTFAAAASDDGPLLFDDLDVVAIVPLIFEDVTVSVEMMPALVSRPVAKSSSLTRNCNIRIATHKQRTSVQCTLVMRRNVRDVVGAIPSVYSFFFAIAPGV